MVKRRSVIRTALEPVMQAAVFGAAVGGTVELHNRQNIPPAEAQASADAPPEGTQNAQMSAVPVGDDIPGSVIAGVVAAGLGYAAAVGARDERRKWKKTEELPAKKDKLRLR